MDTNFRRSSTTDGDTRMRYERRSQTTPLFSTFYDRPEPAASTRPRQSRPASFLRAAIGVIGAVQEHRKEQAQARRAYADMRTSTGPSMRGRNQKSMFGDLDDEYRARRNIYSSREESRSSDYQPRGSARTRYEPEDYFDLDEPEIEDESTAFEREETTLEISDLQARISQEQTELERCSEWLGRNAHRDDVSSRAVADTMEQLSRHKRRLKRAREELRILQAMSDHEEGSNARRRRYRQQSMPEASMRDAGFGAAPDIHNLFDVIFGSSMLHPGMSRGFASEHPLMRESRLFNELFADMPQTHRFVFSTSSAPFFSSSTFGEHFFASRGNEPQFTSQSSRGAPQTAQARSGSSQVPLRLLSNREARDLFETYNNHWNALTPADPAVPYPGRALKSSALLALETISAPDVARPTSEWSKEDIIRANTQHFFLAVVGLRPLFTDRAAKVEMDFEHAGATAADLQQLMDMLKKERIRWHSDRLGRRNGGQPGVNAALQQDEIARGIFHAVCELGELVASKRTA